MGGGKKGGLEYGRVTPEKQDGGLWNGVRKGCELERTL